MAAQMGSRTWAIERQAGKGGGGEEYLPCTAREAPGGDDEWPCPCRRHPSLIPDSTPSPPGPWRPAAAKQARSLPLVGIRRTSDAATAQIGGRSFEIAATGVPPASQTSNTGEFPAAAIIGAAQICPEAHSGSGDAWGRRGWSSWRLGFGGSSGVAPCGSDTGGRGSGVQCLFATLLITNLCDFRFLNIRYTDMCSNMFT